MCCIKYDVLSKNTNMLIYQEIVDIILFLENRHWTWHSTNKTILYWQNDFFRLPYWAARTITININKKESCSQRYNKIDLNYCCFVIIS